MDRFKSLFFRFWGLCYFGFALIFLLDQATKIWALENLPQVSSAYFPYGGWKIAQLSFGDIGSIDLALVLAFNKGAAWSFLQEYPEALLFLRIVLISLVFAWLVFGASSQRWAVLMLLSGACSNLADMLCRGAVVDMISLTFFGYPYPIFNFADMMICIGAFCLMILGVKQGEKV